MTPFRNLPCLKTHSIERVDTGEAQGALEVAIAVSCPPEEIVMNRDRDFEHRPWLIVPAIPHIEGRYRRWDIALISALAFIVISAFLMGIAPTLSHASAGSQQPSVANHANRGD
jgi:hypothetical protein